MNQAPAPHPPTASAALKRREWMLLSAGALAAGAVHAAETFDEPASAEAYVAAMRLGTQAGDYLEMAYEPAGLRNQTRAADFDVMRREGRFDHVRIPANCSQHANAAGEIDEAFLRKVDLQVSLALERFERVVLDPLHHYVQWKGQHSIEPFQDDAPQVAMLTADQHAQRATALWTQLATRYRDHSLRLSFDLFNEPTRAKPDGVHPEGLSPAQLDAWHAAVIPAIRATGGRNAQRMVWLEPWDNQLDRLVLPAGAGPIGVSPHYYAPFAFTHRGGALTAAGLSNYAEDIAYAKRWGEIHRVPVWIGESGVSVNNRETRQPRPPADRAEYTAHIRNVVLQTGVPVCYWGYNSAFAQYDQQRRQWHPGMRQAVTGQPSPLPVREIPPFLRLQGGRVARVVDPGRIWPGFSYDPATGVLTAQANTGGPDRSLLLVFPEVPVAANQSWIARATEFTGQWAIGNCPVFPDMDQKNRKGVPGIDTRARTPLGREVYPVWRAPAPGGTDNPYPDAFTDGSVLGIDLILRAGSPAGTIRLACLRSA